MALTLGFLAGLTACGDHSRGAGGSDARRSPAPAMAAGQQADLDWEDLANASYDGIFDRSVRLIDGRWEGEPFDGGASRPALQIIDGFWATGDLDGDDNQEAVVFLVESSGGSGSRIYVAIVGRRNAQPVNLTTAMVGDRVQLRALRLATGHIELDIVQQGPEDAACCPTQKATRTWLLEREQLTEVSSRVDGQISLGDLAGVEWHLTHFTRNHPLPEDVEITLKFEDNRIAGSSGCNRYFANIVESQPGSVRVSAIGSTRMACPEYVMAIESRYLQAVAGVMKYSFLAGNLALSYRSDELIEVLLYADKRRSNRDGAADTRN